MCVTLYRFCQCSIRALALAFNQTNNALGQKAPVFCGCTGCRLTALFFLHCSEITAPVLFLGSKAAARKV